MSRRKHIFGFGLLVAAATTVPAYAQPSSNQMPTAATMATDFPACTKKPTDGDQELAKQKFIAARQDYEEGTYDSALKRFKTAYEYDCTKPELLLIVSSAFEKRNDVKAALAALEVYLQRAPKDAPDVQTVQAKIENLKKEAAKTAPPPSTSAPPPGGEQQEHTIFPWLVVGLGGAAVVTGLILTLTAGDYPEGCNSDNLRCSVTGNPGAETETQVDANRQEAGNVHGKKVAGPLVMIGGGALVVGGLVWHFLEPTGPKSPTSGRFTPMLSPDFAGLSYGAKF